MKALGDSSSHSRVALLSMFALLSNSSALLIPPRPATIETDFSCSMKGEADIFYPSFFIFMVLLRFVLCPENRCERGVASSPYSIENLLQSPSRAFFPLNGPVIRIETRYYFFSASSIYFCLSISSLIFNVSSSKRSEFPRRTLLLPFCAYSKGSISFTVSLTSSSLGWFCFLVIMISSSMSSTKKSDVGTYSAFGDTAGGEFGVKTSWN